MGVGDKLSALGTFVWNSDEKQFLGRGGKSWAQIGLFYMIYYACLGGFFVGMLAVFSKTLDESRPKLTGLSSLLKANPGMGFKPMPDLEYTLVRYELSVPESQQMMSKSIFKTLKPYLESDANPSENGVRCDKNTVLKDNQFCVFDTLSLMQECNSTNGYGYKRSADGKPCILLRLNKIFDWMPEEYTAENIKNSGASPELQEKILQNPKMIYVDCAGENPADRDYLGEVKYFPEQGFPHYFYPFTNQKGYLSPLVFVKFMGPRRYMALMVECRALAPNINYDRTEKEGGVHFELLVD